LVCCDLLDFEDWKIAYTIGDKALRQVGCKVTILEQSSRLSEIGAGIQLVRYPSPLRVNFPGRLFHLSNRSYQKAPNSTRILRRLGLLNEVLKYANFPLSTIVRSYADDVEIGPRGYSGSIRRRFDAPMLVIVSSGTGTRYRRFTKYQLYAK
jgi:salicylate hydroxylase